LDGFKQINDTLGTAIVDLLLKKVANGLDACRGSTNSTARMGGDEFTLIMPPIHESEEADELAKKILFELEKPIFIQERTHQITSSIGIAIYPLDGEDPKTLMRHADLAMYHAKRN